MSTEDRVGENETEPKSFIVVDKVNSFRGMIAFVKNRRTFENPEEASEWMAEDKGEHYHNVEIPFGEGNTISAWLEGPRDDQRLVVKVSERVGIAPRSVVGHHGAIAPDGANYVTSLIIEGTNDYDDTIIDRGVVWLSVNDEKPTLSFHCLPEKHTREEILAMFSRVNKRAYEVFQDIMNGTVTR